MCNTYCIITKLIIFRGNGGEGLRRLPHLKNKIILGWNPNFFSNFVPRHETNLLSHDEYKI